MLGLVRVLAVLKRMAPKVDVAETVPVPALSVPRAMLPPAPTMMAPPPVVRLPRAATSDTLGPAATVIVPVPVVAIVSPRSRKTMGPVASRTRDQPPGMTAVPALPSCPRSSIVMAAAVIVTVPVVPSGVNVSVP